MTKKTVKDFASGLGLVFERGPLMRKHGEIKEVTGAISGSTPDKKLTSKVVHDRLMELMTACHDHRLVSFTRFLPP